MQHMTVPHMRSLGVPVDSLHVNQEQHLCYLNDTMFGTFVCACVERVCSGRHVQRYGCMYSTNSHPVGMLRRSSASKSCTLICSGS